MGGICRNDQPMGSVASLRMGIVSGMGTRRLTSCPLRFSARHHNIHATLGLQGTAGDAEGILTKDDAETQSEDALFRRTAPK